MLFEFSMSALTALLRRQSEQNPSASYFNVDILKYQVRGFRFSGVRFMRDVCYGFLRQKPDLGSRWHICVEKSEDTSDIKQEIKSRNGLCAWTKMFFSFQKN